MRLNEHRTEFYVARTKLLHGGLISGLLALIGLWMIFVAGSSITHGTSLGLVNLALAAGLLFFAARKSRDPRPHLVVDDDGIWYRDWGLERIPWDQIGDVYNSGIRLNTFACIELRDPASLLEGLTAEQRRRLDANRLVRPPRLLVPNGALDAPLNEVLAAIRAGLQQAGQPTT